ncbi:hypothetical protein AAG906_011122 [Vitis piasezkii]
MFPINNELPLSIYEAKKTLNTLGMESEKIHACPNDCILYRNELNDESSCPTYGTSRWKLDKIRTKKRKGVPTKVMWYFPPIPRFKRLFQSRKFAKDLIWHAQEREFDGKMHHPSDSPSRKLVDHRWPDFASEPRNLRLAISFMMLSLLISGPRQPGNDIDVYLAPLLDDLKMLWEEGVESYDAHRQELFTLRVVLLWTINDFPAYGNLSGCVVKGYFACPICKTKDGLNSRLDLVEMGLRCELGPSKVVDVATLDKLQNDVVVTLCLLEKYFPPSFFDIMLHIREIEDAIGNNEPISETLNFVLWDYYEIRDLDYTMFRIPVFKCDWVDNRNGIKLMTLAKQVFYVQDQHDPRWSVVLSTPQKDFLDRERGDDLVDNFIEHHPFIGALPQVEAFDAMDDSDAICMRGDCEGIWIENKSSM